MPVPIPPSLARVTASSGVPGRAAGGDEIRVLLVDDNLATLARVSTALAPGCTIVGAMRDGQAALAAAGELSPDVIVLDISMPGMNGFELATRLRQRGPRPRWCSSPSTTNTSSSWRRETPGRSATSRSRASPSTCCTRCAKRTRAALLRPLIQRQPRPPILRIGRGELRRPRLRESRQRSLPGGIRPHSPVHAVEALAGHHPHRDLVGQLFGLQIRVVGVDPHVAELVGDHGPQLDRRQLLEKRLLDREQKGRLRCL